MNRVTVTALFSILLLMSFGLTQNVSADEAVFAQCAGFADVVSFATSTTHSVSATVNFDEVTVVAIGGGLTGPLISGLADEAVFILDGLTGSSLSDRASGGVVGIPLHSPVVTFTNLTPGPHTITVCYIERFPDIFFGGTTRILTHTDSVDFSGPPEPFCGDGLVNVPGEQCDELNLPTATCDLNCQTIVPPTCGDGLVNAPREQCDPAPAGSLPTATCDANCMTIPLSCGPGTTKQGLQCDPDVTQAQLDAALAAVTDIEAQRDAILTTLFEFLRVFGVI